MDSVIRALAIYFFLMLIMRLSGKRTLAQVTMFDFILLLIISEATQQALLGDDFSLTNAFIVIVTLIGSSIALSLLERMWPGLEFVLDDTPLLLVQEGQVHERRLKKCRVQEAEIMEAGRRQHGMHSFDQIKHAILERDGGISIIPWKEM